MPGRLKAGLIIILVVGMAAAAGLLLSRGKPPPGKQPPPGKAPPPGEFQALELKVERLVERAMRERKPELFDQGDRLLLEVLPATSEKDRVYAARAALALERHDYKHGPNRPPEKIRELAEEALRLNPRSGRALSVLTRYHMYWEQPSRALAVHRRKVAMDSGNPLDQVLTGEILLHLDRYDEAEKALEKAQELSRKRGDMVALVKAQEKLGLAYRQRGKFAKAEAVLKESAKLTEDAAARQRKLVACPYTALGELYSTTGQNKKAAAMDMRAADREPTAPWIQHRAAIKCYRVDDLDNALKYVKRALALKKDPAYEALLQRIQRARAGAGSGADSSSGDPSRGLLGLAAEAFDGNRFEAAGRHLEQCRKLLAGWTGRLRVLQGFLYLLEKKYDKAGEQFKEAAATEEGAMGARVGQGHLALIAKDHDEARRLLTPAAAAGEALFSDLAVGNKNRKPYRWLVHRMALLGLGWAAANTNQHDEAVKQFDKILARRADDIFAWIGKGNSLNALNKLDAAEAALGRVLRLDPDNKYATAELALVKFNRGEDAAAERLFKAALKQESERYTCPHEGLGLIYLRAGKIDQARDSFKKAIQINPDIEFKKFNGLARIHIREGKYAKARELLKKSMKNYPYDDEAKKLLESIKGK